MFHVNHSHRGPPPSSDGRHSVGPPILPRHHASRGTRSPVPGVHDARETALSVEGLRGSGGTCHIAAGTYGPCPRPPSPLGSRRDHGYLLHRVSRESPPAGRADGHPRAQPLHPGRGRFLHQGGVSRESPPAWVAGVRPGLLTPGPAHPDRGGHRLPSGVAHRRRAVSHFCPLHGPIPVGPTRSTTGRHLVVVDQFLELPRVLPTVRAQFEDIAFDLARRRPQSRYATVTASRSRTTSSCSAAPPRPPVRAALPTAPSEAGSLDRCRPRGPTCPHGPPPAGSACLAVGRGKGDPLATTGTRCFLHGIFADSAAVSTGPLAGGVGHVRSAISSPSPTPQGASAVSISSPILRRGSGRRGTVERRDRITGALVTGHVPAPSLPMARTSSPAARPLCTGTASRSRRQQAWVRIWRRGPPTESTRDGIPDLARGPDVSRESATAKPTVRSPIECAGRDCHCPPLPSAISPHHNPTDCPCLDGRRRRGERTDPEAPR